MKSKTREQRKSKIILKMKFKTRENQTFSVNEKTSKKFSVSKKLHCDFLGSRKFTKFSRKSQTEIIGLAIVVVLLIIGMTFVIRFMLAKEPVDYKKQFTQAEIASNMLNTILKTTSKDCNELTMTQLLQDCGHSKSIFCENGQVSCDYAEETAREVFSNTLDAWRSEE